MVQGDAFLDGIESAGGEGGLEESYLTGVSQIYRLFFSDIPRGEGCKSREFGWISYLEVHEGLGVGDDIDLARTVEPMHQLAARRHG